MEEVIGMRGTPGHGSLMEWGITYRELPLNPNGGLDWEGLATAIVPGKTRVAHIQRSCGYALRPTLTVKEIGRAVQVRLLQEVPARHCLL
jgi:cystathionine beta-lyase family protein involved in aluminum resistance